MKQYFLHFYLTHLFSRDKIFSSRVYIGIKPKTNKGTSRQGDRVMTKAYKSQASPFLLTLFSNLSISLIIRNQALKTIAANCQKRYVVAMKLH